MGRRRAPRRRLRAHVRLQGDIKDGQMLLRGYLGISALGQTRVFHRVNG